MNYLDSTDCDLGVQRVSASKKHKAVFVIVVMIGLSQTANAQQANPLRSLNPNPNAVSSAPVTNMTPEVRDAIYHQPQTSLLQATPMVDYATMPAGHISSAPESKSNQRTSMSEATIQQVMKSVQRVPASTTNKTGNSLPADSRLSARGDDPEIASSTNPLTKTKNGYSKEKFQNLLQSLAMNTALVLALGVGFVFVARQWLKKRPNVSKTDQPKIQIISCLQLGAKSTLCLVEANQKQLVVARDQNGIQSVLLLTDSFGETLSSFDSELTQHKSESVSESLYSMGKLGPSQSTQDEPTKEVKKNVKETKAQRDANVRRQMEKALREHGLQDLIVNLQK